MRTGLGQDRGRPGDRPEVNRRYELLRTSVQEDAETSTDGEAPPMCICNFDPGELGEHQARHAGNVSRIIEHTAYCVIVDL